MGPSHRTLALAMLGMVACAGSSPGGQERPDADPFRPDARVPTCAANSAAIGRCTLAGGGDCAGTPDEDRLFSPLATGDPVPMTVGPQGALMFVLALQTTGIYAGDPDNPASPDNPDVQLTLLLDAIHPMALYRGRPYFEQDSTSSDMLSASGLFVIVEGSASELDGQSITAIAELTDRDGNQRCGQVIFEAAR